MNTHKMSFNRNPRVLWFFSCFVLSTAYFAGDLFGGDLSLGVIDYPIPGEMRVTPIPCDTPIYRVQPPQFPVLPYASPSFARDSNANNRQYFGTAQIYFATNQETLEALRRDQGYFDRGDVVIQKNIAQYISELEKQGYKNVRVLRDVPYDHSVAGGRREGLIIVATPPASSNMVAPEGGGNTCSAPIAQNSSSQFGSYFNQMLNGVRNAASKLGGGITARAKAVPGALATLAKDPSTLANVGSTVGNATGIPHAGEVLGTGALGYGVVQANAAALGISKAQVVANGTKMAANAVRSVAVNGARTVATTVAGAGTTVVAAGAAAVAATGVATYGVVQAVRHSPSRGYCPKGGYSTGYWANFKDLYGW